MDYNDNDYEGQNLHLAGEESSKISVLRPFALPKFDFDDSLHGHLRFDSLVENEVFLGISSQEDNHWIEDFSRGGNGIEFTSTAAETCALPRNINVWSEATSSESVEMLLKAVGQEEMVPGEIMIEESDPGDQQGGSTSVVENKLMDAKVDDGDNGIPLLPLAEVGGSSFSLNQTSGVESKHTECTLQVQETIFSSYGVGIDNKDSSLSGTTENSSFGVKRADDNQAETCGLVDGSLSNQMQEDLPVLVKEIDNTESSSKNVDVSARESVDEDLICSFTSSSSCTVKGTFYPVGEQDKECNETERLSGISLETVNVEKHYSHETTSSMQSPKKEHAVDTCIATMIEASSEQSMGKSVSKDDECNKIAFVVEPAECSQQTAVSGPETNQLSEVDSMYNERSSIVLQGGGIEELGMGGSDDIIPAVTGNDEMKQGLVILSPDRHKIIVENEAVSPESNSLLEGLGTEIKQLSESDSMLHKRSSIVLQEGCTEGLGMGGSVNGSDEMKQGPVIQSPDMHKILDEKNEAVSAESNSFLEGLGTETNQLSESDSMIHERSSIVLQEGGIEGLGMGGSGETVIQSPDRHKILVEIEALPVESNSYLEAPFSTSGLAVLHEVLGNSSEKDHDHKTDDATEDSGKLTSSTVSGECCEKSVIDANAMEDVRNTAALREKNGKDGDHVHPPLVGESTWTSMEDHSMQVVGGESDLNVSIHEKEGEKLSLVSSEMILDDIKEAGSTCHAKGFEVQKTNELKPESSALDTEVEGTKLAVLCVEGNQSADLREHSLLSSDMELKDQSREIESKAPKQSNPSSPKEAHDKNTLSPATEIEKDAIPACVEGDIKTSHQSVSLLETSGVNIPDESSKELSKMMENPVSALLSQTDDVEASPSKKQMVAETGKNSGANSSVADSTVKTDESNKDAVPGATCTDLSQSEVNKQISLSQRDVNKQTSLERNAIENFGKMLNTSETSGVNDPCKEDETFTFDTMPLVGQSTEDSSKGLQPFPRLQACKDLAGEGFLAASVSSQKDPIIVKETSHVGSSTPGVCPPSGGVGAPSERKSRRGGNRSGKGSLKKGNLVKETSLLKQTEKGDKSSPFLSPLSAGQLMTFESGLKPMGAVSIPTSSLPDLNTSAPSSSFFRQPFTDLQQVQLRAQIFVYGSLIQGAPPDEACMVSAFGMSDGGRNIWERSWRACAERLHSQKSQGNNTGTPVPSRSGAKTPDQNNRQVFPQSEVLPSTTGRPSNKAIPSPVNPAIPLSSPLWNISTPSAEVLPPGSMARSAVIDYQAVSPLNYQTPPIRNYIAHSTWPAQTPPAPFPVPWLASSQSSPFEISTSYPVFPTTEPVKLTAVKESPLPITSGMKNASPIPTTNTGATALLAGASSLDVKRAKASTGQTGDAKTRKRKKSSGSEDVVQIAAPARLSDAVSAHAVPNQLSNKSPAEDLSQIPLIAQNQVGLVPTPVGSYYSAYPVVQPSISSGHISKGDFNMDKRVLNSEGFSKVEEAKLQAQEAAAHAAAAISHCESVWSQLDLQKSSGLTSDAESKLASAAAAIAAAASVAKAASAAARIAAGAAVQAKQMADEAFITPGTSNNTEYDSSFVYNPINLVNASPTPILKGGDRNNAPNLVISAAREAARKRIEAASAATRHAENLDAILKAAELAAEAVAQAGKVVAMGDPFSLSALAEAGPSNFWKVPQSLPDSKLNDINRIKSTSNTAAEVPSVCNQHDGPDKDVRVTSHNMSPIQRELLKDTSELVSVEENLISSVKHGENSSKHHNDRNVSDSAKTTFVVSDPDIESRSSMSATSMREGSLVEVLKDRGDSKKAWFSARILSLKDVEALVCYDVLQSDEGSEQLKEWISIEAKGVDTPRIRVPHPMTAMHFEGTRKRRRAAVRDYTWSVGDHVDVWMQDCWREGGIVAEKIKKDATSISVHFPAQGETLMVKVWHLRPCLIWSDGEWTEWCRPGQDGTHQGDTPVEKRQKLASTSTEAKGKAKMAKNIDFAEAVGNEEPKLPLSANEKVFSVGSRKEDNKLNMGRTMRSGLEKEGSRVVFGVPKPGKKRKFMEVSKHYVSDRISKTNVPNDSMKLSKFLVPQGSGSRVFKTSSKLDPKGKQVADSKLRALKSGKPPSIPSRTLARRDDSTSSRSNARDAAQSDQTAKGSTSNDENESSEQNIPEVDETSDGAMVFSSQALPQENRKKAVRNIKSDHLNQRKPSSSGKSAKDEATEKSIPEVSEPRRSNRRIQPTSRLLEGLQSSLIVTKIPSSSHDKGHRSHIKGAATGSRGNNNRG